MKKSLVRALSHCLVLALFCSLLLPAAQAGSAGPESISIDAKAALLVDLDSDQVLYEQDADQQEYPASITKIMTALLTLEAIDRGELSLETVVTVSASALTDITDDSSTQNIAVGEQLSVRNLLYCLLLPSANEAANILAMTVCGDIPTFVGRMNARAAELGMTGTHFVNPHGLHSSDHYSTARDIYRMTKQAMTHDTFRKIVSSSTYTVPATNLSAARVLYNTNGLLTQYKYPGYTYKPTIGIKTGSTGEAGYCLVAAAKQKGHTLISVVLGADNPSNGRGGINRKQFSESKRLLQWGFSNFSSQTLLDADSTMEEVPVRFSLRSSYVVIRPAQSLKVLIPGTYDPTKRETKVDLTHEKVTAPVSAGDVLGTITVTYDGQQYGVVDMVAVSDVPLSPFLAFIMSVNSLLGNLYVRLGLLAVLILLVIGIVRRLRTERHLAWKAEREKQRREKKARRQRKRQEELEHQRRKQARQREHTQHGNPPPRRRDAPRQSSAHRK